jgi:hypothetical protein
MKLFLLLLEIVNMMQNVITITVTVIIIIIVVVVVVVITCLLDSLC